MDVEVERLREHVAALAGSPRPAESRALDAARDYVAGHFKSCGWNVERVVFDAVSPDGIGLCGVNLVARRGDWGPPGLPRLCIGAHVDSVPSSPGADDNASAVAVLLEIARLLPELRPAVPRLEPELVAFDLEECGMLGGADHARRTRRQGIDLRGMVSLEMVGYCDHRPGSQSLPRSLVGLYPEVGNFIGVIGNQNSESLLSAFRTGMQRVADLPIECLLVPDNGNMLQATRLSDHSPFWDADFAALMVTDTSFLRNPHYHLPSDTPETLDMEFLTRVAQGCLEAARHVVEIGL
jgi:Zn-dependent M28 family amino/carboxypeptidase